MSAISPVPPALALPHSRSKNFPLPQRQSQPPLPSGPASASAASSPPTAAANPNRDLRSGVALASSLSGHSSEPEASATAITRASPPCVAPFTCPVWHDPGGEAEGRGPPCPLTIHTVHQTSNFSRATQSTQFHRCSTPPGISSLPCIPCFPW